MLPKGNTKLKNAEMCIKNDVFFSFCVNMILILIVLNNANIWIKDITMQYPVLILTFF